MLRVDNNVVCTRQTDVLYTVLLLKATAGTNERGGSASKHTSAGRTEAEVCVCDLWNVHGRKATTYRVLLAHGNKGAHSCDHLFLMLFLKPLKTTDRFLLGLIGRLCRRGRLVARLRLFSYAPRRGLFKVFSMEALLFWIGLVSVRARLGGGALRHTNSATLKNA